MEQFFLRCLIKWFINQRHNVPVALRGLENLQLQVDHTGFTLVINDNVEHDYISLLLRGTPYSTCLYYLLRKKKIMLSQSYDNSLQITALLWMVQVFLWYLTGNILHFMVTF